jgi:ATP phosphoribosyltransferase regulatory subunit
MAAHERWQQVPAGMRDLLPGAAARARAVTARMLARMRAWGYGEVVTPTIEYFDTLVRGGGTEAGDRLFKLVDRGGQILALRPEMTTPVARLVATHLRGHPLPIRLAYAGQVFRGSEAGAGRPREFTQVGAELVGAATRDADAEILALAAECLEASGAPACAISVGHTGFLRGMLEGVGLPADAAPDLRRLVSDKDFAGVRVLLQRHGVDRERAEALAQLPVLSGPAALRDARGLAGNAEAQRALCDLEDLMARLDAYGVAERVRIDLGIIRDFDYYTGIVFEGHTPAAGAALLGGGRYDGLLAGFGVPHPATGFAVRVDRVLAAAGDGSAWAPDVAVAFDPSGRAAAVRLASALRARRLAVALDVLGAPWDETAARAFAAGVPRAVQVSGDRAVIREREGAERRVALADLPAELAPRAETSWRP